MGERYSELGEVKLWTPRTFVRGALWAAMLVTALSVDHYATAPRHHIHVNGFETPPPEPEPSLIDDVASRVATPLALAVIALALATTESRRKVAATNGPFDLAAYWPVMIWALLEVLDLRSICQSHVYAVGVPRVQWLLRQPLALVLGLMPLLAICFATDALMRWKAGNAWKSLSLSLPLTLLAPIGSVAISWTAFLAWVTLVPLW